MKQLVKVTRTQEFWVEYDGRQLNDQQLLDVMAAERVAPNCFHGRAWGSIMASSLVAASTYDVEIIKPDHVECQMCGGTRSVGEHRPGWGRSVRPCPDCTPEYVEPLCDACNDTGFVDDLDNDGASVRCEWCPTPENVDGLS